MSVSKALAVVVALAVLLVLVSWGLIRLAGLEASLLWTAIVGAIAWAIRNSIEQKREHLRLLAETKREHYIEFLDFINSAIARNKVDESAGAAERNNQPVLPIEEFRKWSLRLTLVGSDEVVQAWNDARLGGAIASKEGDAVAVLKGWGKLWLAMRKDCGHSDTKLKVSDVLASFVNDIEQYRDAVDGNATPRLGIVDCSATARSPM